MMAWGWLGDLLRFAVRPWLCRNIGHTWEPRWDLDVAWWECRRCGASSHGPDHEPP